MKGFLNKVQGKGKPSEPVSGSGGAVKSSVVESYPSANNGSPSPTNSPVSGIKPEATPRADILLPRGRERRYLTQYHFL
jgi:hypothetical protein